MKASYPNRYHNRDDKPPWWAFILVWITVFVFTIALWIGIIAGAIWVVQQVTT